ncbi:MAG TPA: glutathione S-transferase family protein [candidate division Zixibacteria bacterium]|nr:glutathione S-transferase family protein [candidate division Zixibacteria bacterium]
MAVRLFQSQTSMFCEKVRVVLAMKQVPYEIVDVRKDDRKSLIAYSNQRKVPVMDYHGQCVIDSTTIAAFLEQKHPANSIYPANPSDKGLCLLLEDWSDEVLIQANHAIRRAETEEARKKAEEAFQVHFGSLDQLFTGRTFIFDRMTIADISIFSQLHYLYTVVHYEIPGRYENLNAWLERMRRALKLNSLAESFAAPSL